jgi:hypothetical protein
MSLSFLQACDCRRDDALCSVADRVVSLDVASRVLNILPVLDRRSAAEVSKLWWAASLDPLSWRVCDFGFALSRAMLEDECNVGGSRVPFP